MEQADSLGEETIKTQVTRLPTTHIIKRTVMVKKKQNKNKQTELETQSCYGGEHWGLLNLKTLEKTIQNRKTGKNFDQNRKLHAKLSETDTFSPGWYPSYWNPDRSDTVVTSGAYRVNYTNFITGFMNAMDLAFVSSSICLN